MTSNIVLWIYIVLVLAGGLVGYFKAGSKPSLIAGAVSALLLALAALGILPAGSAPVIVGLLIITFGMRLAKTKKFMPAGMMLILSVVVLALLLRLR